MISTIKIKIQLPLIKQYSFKNWYLEDVYLIDVNGIKNYYKSLVYNSSFNGEIISNLFSNLNSLNIYELHSLSKSYSKLDIQIQT